MTPVQTHPFRTVVWPLAVAETILWAATYYSFPALLPVWERELGWSKTELTAAFTLALVVSALLAPVAGRLIDHGRSRLIFIGGALLGATVLVLLSQVTTLWQFILLWIAMGVALSATLYEACFAVLTRCMGPQAKRAITLVTLVAGFAGTLSFPSANALASAIGWRGTLIVFAGAVVLVAVPLIWIGCRAAEEHGMTHAPPASGRASQAMAASRTAVFWLLAVAFAVLSMDHGMVISHILPLLADRGVDEQAAVLAASMIGPMQVAGRLAMMAAERFVSTLAIGVGCFVALGLASGALFGAGSAPGLVAIFVIFQGAGAGVTSIMRPVLIAELLGRKDFGVVSGMLAVPAMGGLAAAPLLASLVWQAGGYDLVLSLVIVTSAVGLLSLLAAWRAASPQA